MTRPPSRGRRSAPPADYPDEPRYAGDGFDGDLPPRNGNGPSVNIAEMERMQREELIGVALEQGIDNPAALPKQELIFRILQALVRYLSVNHEIL